LASATNAVLDDVNHRMFISGTDNGKFVLLTLDILTGTTISKVNVGRMTAMGFNNSTGKLYCLANKIVGNVSVFTLCTINSNTGEFSVIKDLPAAIKGIVQGNESFDEDNNLFFFVAEESPGSEFLYTINAGSGIVVNRTLVPMTNSEHENNVIQFRFDNAGNKLYALHWEAKSGGPFPDSSCRLDIQMEVYPNPFRDVLIVKKTPSTCSVRMNLYSSLGQILIRDKIINDGQNPVRINHLPAGIYFYKLFTSGSNSLSGKLIRR